MSSREESGMSNSDAHYRSGSHSAFVRMTLYVGGVHYRVLQAGGGQICFHDAVEFPASVGPGSNGHLTGELVIEIDASQERWAVEFERPHDRVSAVGARFRALSA